MGRGRAGPCYISPMAREITHEYLDPLDAIWIAAAEGVGLRVERSADAFASSDGRGRLAIGTRETLDPDDCLAQMILHELCHSLVEGPSSLGREDWGLDNETDRDLAREHACLRVQAALTAPHGLRRVLAPTTEHRAFYDALPTDPLSPRHDPTAIAARLALARSTEPPWSPHLARALEATATVVHAARGSAPPRSLLALADPPPAPHPATKGQALSCGPQMVTVAANGESCGTCAWRFSGGRGRAVDRCRHAGGARVDPSWPACDRFEPDEDVDCVRCGACCREAYGAVVVSARDPVVRRHPALIERDGDTLLLRREGDRCAALDRDADRYTCRIYEGRPRTCREFERRGEHCLTARRRVGLS